MANTIPCPNPVCTHDFSMAELQAASQLLCPKCGFRMQGKGEAKPKPGVAPAKPTALPANKAALPKPASVRPALPPAAKPVSPASAKPVAAAASPKPAVAKPITTPVPATAKVALATAVPAGVGNPPMATPVAADPAPTATEESLSDDAFFNPNTGGAGTLVRTNRAKKKFNWLQLLVIVFAVGFAICIVVAAIGTILLFFPDMQGMFSKNEGESFIGIHRNIKNENEKIYKLVLSRKDWSPDTEIARDFKAHAAWKHNTEDFWFALAVKDYGMFKPRDAEMLGEAIDKLEQHFGDAMELAKMAESVKFGSLNAQKIQFAGTIHEARWLGECYMFFNNGIAYWLFVASPDGAVLERLAADLAEKHVFVLSERRGWREQPTPMATFASQNGKVEITVPKDVWDKGSPKDEFETGELMLAGKYRKEKDGRKNAFLTIFTMEKKDDLPAALKAARELIEGKVKNDNEKFKIVQATDAAEEVAGQKDIGGLTDVGNRRGRMIDLKLQFEDEPKRYYLLVVINEPDLCYAILCDCAWESRQIWRQDFKDVLRSLTVK